MINPVGFEILKYAATSFSLPEFGFNRLNSPEKIIELQKSLFEYQIKVELISKGIDSFSSTARRLGSGQS